MPVHRHPVATSKGAEYLALVPVSPAVVQHLRSSFAQVRRHGDRLGELFYARLFAAAPQVRGMFKSEPKVQSAKLLASLEAIVRNLEDPAANAAMIAELGRRHAGYGARPEHYALVVELLVASIGEILGGAAEGQTLGQWRTALELVSRQMIAAGDSGAQTPPARQER